MARDGIGGRRRLDKILLQEKAPLRPSGWKLRALRCCFLKSNLNLGLVARNSYLTIFWLVSMDCRVDQFLSRSLSAEAVRTLQHIRSLPTYRGEGRRASRGWREEERLSRTPRQEDFYGPQGGESMRVRSGYHKEARELVFKPEFRQTPAASPGSSSYAGTT